MPPISAVKGGLFLRSDGRWTAHWGGADDDEDGEERRRTY